jgi:thioesterase domain-containing protein
VVTALTLTGAENAWPALPSIGYPVANTRCYVLDKAGEPCPIGIPGELYLGGAQVALGYLNQPELTAERFIDNPFDTDPDSKLYKTGDLVRWLANGTIEFIGRIDNQIKLRGFRIELGEIEAVLIQHSDVVQGVVVLREDNPGDQRLVAYVKSATGPEVKVDTAELREHLKTNLPDYMVPSAFMILDVIPLTPNGKVDRKALPIPEYAAETEYVAPRDETEQQLADIWQALLRIEQVGIHDNFFKLGGHSLLVITLISRIQNKLDPTAELWMMFNYPTIAEFAGRLKSLLSSDGIVPVISRDVVPHPALMQVNLTGTNPPLFCVFGEPALLASKLRKDRPVYSLNTAYGEGDIATAPSDINEAAHIYIEAIRSVQPTGPYFLYGHCSGATIAYEIARLLLADGDDVSHACLLEPTTDGRGMKEIAVMMIQGIRSNGFSVARVKALLSVSSSLLRRVPAFARNKLQLLWHSSLGTAPSMPLRLLSHQTKVAPSVHTYVYQEVGCSVSIIYRNLDEVQSGESKKYWEKVVGHEVRMHSVEVGAEHLAVLEDTPLETIAAVIDKSLSEATLPKKDVVVN